MKTNLKSLENFNSEILEKYVEFTTSISKPRPNGIECPNCKNELSDNNPDVSLTSNPPQKNVFCPTCGYKGFRLSF